MNYPETFTAIFIMALITYVIRMLPLVFLKRKIKNQFIRSFLHYVPYAVLAAMTFPGVLYSTSSLISAIAGVIIALILAYKNQGIFTVAVSATFIVLLTEQFINLLYNF